MSDPGIGYRSRDEVIDTRKQRDPIEYIKNIIIKNDIMSEKEIKNLEKEIRSSVDKEAEKAKKGSQPNNEDLYSYIYSDGNGGNELLPFIRMPELEKSIKNNK
jgi:pyruvate dehydrogenase E1 component alpha subunit